MSILPIIDLLILVGWSSLMFGALLKAIDMTTRYDPSIAGLSSLDFAVIAGVCFGFALTLAARTWVKLNEPRLAELRRQRIVEEAHRQVRELQGMGNGNGVEDESGEAPPGARAAGADRS